MQMTTTAKNNAITKSFLYQQVMLTKPKVKLQPVSHLQKYKKSMKTAKYQ